MSLASIIAAHWLELFIGAISGVVLTETVKRDRKRKADVDNLSALQLRVYACAFASVMTAVPMLAFATDLTLHQVIALSICNGVLYVVAATVVLSLIKSRNPSMAAAIRRAASGELDETTIRRKPPGAGNA